MTIDPLAIALGVIIGENAILVRVGPPGARAASAALLLGAVVSLGIHLLVVGP